MIPLSRHDYNRGTTRYQQEAATFRLMSSLYPMITLPDISYPYNALEPYIDAETMRIHHTKHHQAYIDKLNGLMDKQPELKQHSVESLLSMLESLPLDEKEKTILRNHGGGHVNHTFFWQLMNPANTKDAALAKRITETFGSVDAFKEVFSNGALNHFGSGWMWLVQKPDKSLHLYSTPNQNSPYLSGHTPVIGLDIWEHAYYLKYQNRRADYIKAWWNVIKII